MAHLLGGKILKKCRNSEPRKALKNQSFRKNEKSLKMAKKI